MDVQKRIADSLEKIAKLLQIQIEYETGQPVQLNTKEVKNDSVTKTKGRKTAKH